MIKTVILKGLCCPSCTTEIEHSVSRIEGVKTASIAFVTQRMTIEFCDCDEKTERDMMKKIKKAVRRIEPDVEFDF